MALVELAEAARDLREELEVLLAAMVVDRPDLEGVMAVALARARDLEAAMAALVLGVE